MHTDPVGCVINRPPGSGSVILLYVSPESGFGSLLLRDLNKYFKKFYNFNYLSYFPVPYLVDTIFLSMAIKMSR